MDTLIPSEMPQTSSLEASLARQNQNLQRIQKSRIARSLIVPTDDAEVRKHLRARGLPTCLFGEDAYDRRKRLRDVLADEAMHSDDKPEPTPTTETEPEKETETQQEYYTEGSTFLKDLRIALAAPSLTRSRERLKRERFGWDEDAKMAEERMIERIRNSETVASTPDERPVCGVAVSGNRVVTGSFGGGVAVWDIGTCELVKRLETHDARISTVRLYDGGEVLLTSSGDGSACLQSSEEGGYKLRNRLTGHSGRVTDAVRHPFRTGLVVTAGLDGDIRLSDSGAEVLVQPSGHTGVQRLDVHPDGSLLATAGREGGARVWDLRTGRCIITLTGAHTQVNTVTFHDNLLITGGGDNVVRIWELRKRRCQKTLAAHSGLVSGVCVDGDIMYSSGYDGVVRAWGIRRNFGCVGVWTGLGRVMAVANYENGVVAGCWDRTWKVWSAE